MFFLDEYLIGKGLNFTDIYNNKCKKIEEYSVRVIPFYNFVLCDFEKLVNKENELVNFSHSLNNNGYLIIRQKNTHEECYEEIFFYNELLNSYSLSLKLFESDEDYNYFIFKKIKIKQSLFIGTVSNNKEKVIKIAKEIVNSNLNEEYFIKFHILSSEPIWQDASVYVSLPKFSSLGIFLQHNETGFENNKLVYNWNKLINICRTKQILLINDNFEISKFKKDIPFTKNYLYFKDINKIRRLNGLDFKYNSLEWCLYDLSTRFKLNFNIPEYNEKDSSRYEFKKKNNILGDSYRFINIHEALGDNICSFNLLESLKENNIEVGTVYPFLYELSGDIKLRQDKHELNSLGFMVYEHGSELKCKSLEYAYFSMLGEEELYKKRKHKIFYNRENVYKLLAEYKNKKIVLIAPSASNREGPNNGVMKSNKSWNFERWQKVVTHLQNKGYYVIQVGVKEDFKVDNVNEFFFNRSFNDLVALITISKFFLGLDTFFQHLCGLMKKKGIVVTPAHNDHAFWPSIIYIVGKVKEDFENMKWLKDHLNPYRASCMNNISIENVITEVDKLIDSFDKY